MKTAGENLTPVTLELGGKSPTIVAAITTCKKAAERILLRQVHERRADLRGPGLSLFLPRRPGGAFVEAAKEYDPHPLSRLGPSDYTSIISRSAYHRLLGLLEDARDPGCRGDQPAARQRTR
jgi:coniferyl-aldehyde dehydrogenase